jgi:ArsR family transcriptional regulator
MTDQNFESELNFLKCISGEIRFEILHLLREESLSVGEITEELDIDQTLASHHLKKMHECGIVEKERDGKKIIYSISSDSINDLVDNIQNVCGKVC